MKIVMGIIRYIIVVFITLGIGIIFLANLANTTVLSKDYIISKFKENDYYDKIYNDINESFSTYIMQSGLEEEIISGIISKEKIEKDTNIIISNIYDGKNDVIDAIEIEQKLNQNIENYLQNKKLTQASKDSIQKFVKLISDDYIIMIMHTSHEGKINYYINLIRDRLNFGYKITKYVMVFLIILMLIINKKSFNKNISMIGCSLLFGGFIIFYGKYLINKHIDIENLYVISKGISDIIKSIINENIEYIYSIGKKAVIGGGILIFIGNSLRIIFMKRPKYPILSLKDRY